MTERKLVGNKNFVRHNPFSDKFEILNFDHLEFYTSDATNVSRRFCWGLGMNQIAKSDLSTGNKRYASYVMKSQQIKFVFTAPFHNLADCAGSNDPHPNFNNDDAHEFVKQHGLAVKALGLRVADARVAFETSIANGAVGVLPPVELAHKPTGTSLWVSEVKHAGDVVMRFVSGDYEGPFLPGYETTETPDLNFGLYRVDHAVTNVPHLFNQVDYSMGFTGFHEFGEFTAEDVGTVDSGLNSMVLANNNEFVLLPVNEPTFGTRRKSQIQTYLEANNGAGIQHIAIITPNIFHTIREMRQRSLIGGFEFMPAPGPEYYANIPQRCGEDTLTADQIREVQELGLLVDRDDKGVLIQVFTKPVGDRPTIFLEIIQRIGCDKDETGNQIEQVGGCGGFGKGNFSELFKSIEEFEKQMEAAALAATAAKAGDV